MANSYHMEALRKQRLLDRKNEALTRLESQGSDLTREAVMDGYLSKKTPKESVLITDGGQFDQQRSSNSSYQYMSSMPREEGVVFGEVVHDPNFKYRILKSAGSAPVHVDPIHKIIQNPESLLAKNLRKGFDFSQNRKHRLEINSVPNLPPPTILAIQRDHVYKIFHPYDFHTKSVHSWIGKEWNRRQYDHSREGPVLPRTWTSLKKELEFREVTTSFFGASAAKTNSS